MQGTARCPGPHRNGLRQNVRARICVHLLPVTRQCDRVKSTILPKKGESRLWQEIAK